MVKYTKVSGVICEFNPLHNGHKHLLDTIKKETDGYTVCVMSGNYVQRGECAVMDKFTRTKLCLENGADLVIELPVSFAVSGAEKFSLGGIYLLNSLGCVDNLYFGSETGDTVKLSHLAEFLLSQEYADAVKKYVNNGNSFAATREMVVEKHLGREFSLSLRNPNDILGIEYIKAIKSLKSSISPKTIIRKGAAHDGDGDGSITSAMSIRRMTEEGMSFADYVPKETADAAASLASAGLFPRSLKYNERGILSFLRTTSAKDLINTADIGEGLENKIKKAASDAKNLEELYDLIKSKRYSHARIRRIILSAYLGITKDFSYLPGYIRILGMNSNGLEIIRSKTSSLPFVSSYSDIKKLSESDQNLFLLEAKADDIYGLLSPTVEKSGTYFTHPIIKV